MKIYRAASIRTYLVFLVLLTILPSMGFAVYEAVVQYRMANVEARTEALRVTRMASANYEQLIEGARQLLEVMSQLREVQENDTPSCSVLFSRTLRKYPHYSTFGLINLKGNLICSTPERRLPLSLSDFNFFRIAFLTGSFAIGEFKIDPITNKPALHFAYPVLNQNGEVQSVLFAALDLESLDALTRRITLPTDSVLTLTDRNGIVLSRFPAEKNFIGQMMPETAVVQKLRNQQVEGAVEISGKPSMLCVFTSPIGASLGGDVHVSLSMPNTVVFAPVNRLFAVNLGLLGLVSILALIASFGGSNFLLRRHIQPLLATTKRIAGGDFSARTGLAASLSEIQELIHAFDSMAESLQNREISLKEAETRYRELVERLPVVTYTAALDEHCTITYISPQIEKMLGFPLDAWITDQGLKFRQIHQEDSQCVLDAYNQTRRSGKILDLSFRMITQSGQIRWVREKAQPIAGNERGVTILQGIMYDKTAQVQAENDRNRLVEILESTTDLVATVDRGGRLLYLNNAGLKMLGLTPNRKFSDLNLFDFRAPRSLSLLMSEGIPRAEREGVWTGETEYLNENRESIPVSEVLIAHQSRDSGNSCLSFMARDISARKRAEQQIQNQLGHLSALHKIDMAITGSLDLRLTLNIVLHQIAAQLKIDALRILLYNPQTRMLEHAAGYQLSPNGISRKITLDEGPPGKAVFERQMVVSYASETDDYLKRLSPGNGYNTYFAVPLIAKGQVKGVMELFSSEQSLPSEDWFDFLDALATQAAIAVENTTLFNELQRTNDHLQQAYEASLEGWAAALELRDHETEGHCRRVTDLTVELAHSLGINESEIINIRRGALLHDIGKMGIPDSILLKPGPLTSEERSIIQKHPVYARELLASIPYLNAALDIPYYHHEKWDGTGYPAGLAGNNIPLAARIFAIVDTWDALRHDRPYASSWPIEQVKEYISEQAGKHFDPQLVRAFLKLDLANY